MPTPRTLLSGCSCLILALVIGCSSAPPQKVAEPDAFELSPPQVPILVGTSGRALPLPPQRYESLRLALLPDRTAGQPWGLPYLARAAEDLSRTRPDALIGVGDMVQGYTRSTAQFRQEAAEFQGVLAGLDVPFYPAPGNHDIVSGSRESGDSTFVDLYEELFGPRYYAVDFGLAYVVVLCTEDLAASGGSPVFGGEQLAFLDRALASGMERQLPIFVFMHRPAWRSRGSNFLSEVHPRLVAAGVDAVIAGHFHSLQRDPDRDGIQYHILGVCGGMIDQHPLTGQLHHLSYLTVQPDGSFSLYHSPVGHTLPDDWILTEDQNRAYSLKSRAAGKFTALPQPLGQPVNGSTTIELRNPLDRPIQVRAELVNGVPEPVLVEGQSFYSTTERDIFSAHNTHAATPFRMVGHGGVRTLGPDERLDFEVELASPAQSSMTPPPEVHLHLMFEDSQGREVPIVVRRRVPLTMSLDLAAGEVDALLLWAWQASVYDNDEPVPTMTLARSGDDLYLALQVPDDEVVVSEASLDDRTRVHDPLEDTVVLRVGDERYLIDPFADADNQVLEILEHDGKALLVPTERVVSSARRTPDGYGLRAVVRQAPSPIRLDVQVADNDGGYFTQWRQLSAPWLEPWGVEVR